jgi:hypothetical protein
MAIIDAALLKSKFKSGSAPTGQDFTDLIDTLLAISTDGETGPQGAAGPQGSAGATGAQGPSGFNGTVDTREFYTKAEIDAIIDSLK